MGEEEFAVILPATDGAVAYTIMDDIRQCFTQIRQQAEDREFSATFSCAFSCGMAVWPTLSDVGSLSTAADKALYQVKHQGRNWVVLAKQ